MAMPEERSLEGWVPKLDGKLTLEQVIDLAFDYRGDVTVVNKSGSRVVGYVFNRDRTAPEPFLQLYDEKGNGPTRLAYSEIANIHFTGRDRAAGKSWEAWLARKGRAPGQARKQRS